MDPDISAGCTDQEYQDDRDDPDRCLYGRILETCRHDPGDRPVKAQRRQCVAARETETFDGGVRDKSGRAWAGDNPLKTVMQGNLPGHSDNEKHEGAKPPQEDEDNAGSAAGNEEVKCGSELRYGEEQRGPQR